MAAAASALAAVALALAVAGRGCRDEDESPEGALRAFAAAARVGDRAAMYGLLGPKTRAHLAAAAQRASEVAGGDRRFAPAEMLGAASEQPTAHGFRVVDRQEGRVKVDATAPDGTTVQYTVVRVNGHWRVELVPVEPAGDT